MNICFITSVFLPEITGVSNHLYHMAGHFSKMGHNVLILCPDYGVEKEIYPDYPKYRGKIMDNVTVRPVPSQKNLRRVQSVNYQQGTAWNLEQVIGDFRPDIIQVDDPDRIYGLKLFGLEETLAYNEAIGVSYAGKNDIPIVGFYHVNYGAIAGYYDFIVGDGPTPFKTDPAGVYKTIYGAYDKVLCSCEDARRYLTDYGLAHVQQGIYVGVNDTFFSISEKSCLIPRNDSIKVMYSGRFDGGKDIDRVIEIFKKARTRQSSIQLYLAGAGGKETMEYVMKECHENSRITYVGNLDLTELVKVYNSVDIYLSPYTESFGLSIIEAMAKGLPVIAYNQGGPVSFINNGENGMLCTEEEVFINTMIKVAGDRQLRHTLGGNALKTAHIYSSSNCARNLLHTYGELIDTRKKRIHGS